VDHMDIRLRIEVVDAKVLVPHEDILVGRHNARVQESLGEPPFYLGKNLKIVSAFVCSLEFRYISGTSGISIIFLFFSSARGLKFPTELG
jgi:hypothetical protein